jgi:hypothetical protein
MADTQPVHTSYYITLRLITVYIFTICETDKVRHVMLGSKIVGPLRDLI